MIVLFFGRGVVATLRIRPIAAPDNVDLSSAKVTGRTVLVIGKDCCGGQQDHDLCSQEGAMICGKKDDSRYIGLLLEGDLRN
jgi:hypothetical protein